MKRIIVSILMIPLSAYAQGGLVFEQGLSWQQVLEKARVQHKYIFVDCFATWCGPCKAMDRNVYPKDSVGDYMNKRFIAVKVQMDSTKQDDAVVHSWYADAHALHDTYKVTAFPTFLFFSPEGVPVHRGVGSRRMEDFLALAADAINPAHQYYTLVKEFRQGKLDYSRMPALARMARGFKDDDVGTAVARKYLDHLYALPEDSLYTHGNIEFIANFIQGTGEKGFGLFFHHDERVDQIMGKKGYSKAEVDYLIAKYHIDARLWVDGRPVTDKPDWAAISADIRTKFGEAYAGRTVVGAQIRWYMERKDWSKVAKYTIEQLEKYGPDTSGMGRFYLNNRIWVVFVVHCEDRTLLEKAIPYQGMIIKMDPNGLNAVDTYANLLYKAGRTGEAIEEEKRAVELENINAAKLNREPSPEYRETLEKMKRGEPITFK